MYWKPTRLLRRRFHRFGRLWRTLAFRLTAAYAAAGLLLVCLATLSLYVMLNSELDRSTELFLRDKVNVLRTMLRERPDDLEGLHEEVELESAARRYEHFYIRLLDQHGQQWIVTPGMASELNLTSLQNLVSKTDGVVMPLKGRTGKVFHVVAAHVATGRVGSQEVTIQVAVDVSRKEELLERFRFWFWILFSGLLVLFPFVGYQIARQGIRPVEEIATTARRITSSHLGERIAAEGYPYELASLAVTINNMLDGLESSFERISRFSADIAHDLRTPVNNIRGEAEVALARARSVEEYRDALESTLEEAVRLSDLIANLLFLARTESPLHHLRLETVDVEQLLEGIREYYDAPAADVSVRLTTLKARQQVIAEIDRTLLQRAIGNLVSNAVAHTPQGGTVELSARHHADQVLIEVIDTGVGIPPDALPKVFDRFFRVDPSRFSASGNTGLGLSIVQGIMQLHRGTVDIVSQPGAGTRVTLTMPAKN